MNQLTLFNLHNYTNYDETQEPPDPDDYQTLEQYEYAWKQWEKKYPELVPYVRAMSDVREQVTDATTEARNLNHSVREQVNEDTKKSAPEHTHWVEQYWVKRCGKKHKYYRYCWMSGRKMHRCHICSVHFPLATARTQMVENAIADGKSPADIEKLIRSWREEK